MTDDPLVGDDDNFNQQLFPIQEAEELEGLCHLFIFSVQSSSYYHLLVLVLQMWSKYNSSSPMNIYFRSNAQSWVNGFYTLF